MDDPHSPTKSKETQSFAHVGTDAASGHPERWVVNSSPRFTRDESANVITRIHAQNETSRPLPPLSLFLQGPSHRTETRAQQIHQDQDTRGGEQKQPAEEVAISKRSRYLREMDRRDILSRLEDGERQCDLAQEYNVSRAAISNLFRHREDVLSRLDAYPLTMRPKKTSTRTSENPLQDTMGPSRDLDRRLQASMVSRNADIHRRVVHEVKSRSISLLMTTLHDRSVSTDVFRGHANRLLRALIEEALAFVPLRSVDVGVTGDATKPGVITEFVPCAVSMENYGTPMLDQFRVMEPDRPSGVLDIRPAGGGPIAVSVRLFNLLLPATLEQLNVFLLAPLAVSSQEMCLALETLLAERADESKVLVVCAIVSAEVIATVCHQFPRVRILTTEIDATPLLTSNTSNPTSSAWCQLLVDRWASAYGTSCSSIAHP